MSTNWKSLAPVPNPYSDYRDTFVVLFNTETNTLFSITKKCTLHKYSFDTDSWTHHKIVNNMGSIDKSFPIAINSKTNTIYICDRKGQMAILKIKNNNKSKWEIIYGPYFNALLAPKAMIIDDELHIISGWSYDQHSQGWPK